MNDYKQKLLISDFKSKTPTKNFRSENLDILSLKLDSKTNSKRTRNEKVFKLTGNPTEKKLQTMKFDFYIKNTIDTEIVGNTNVGVYKRINSPLIPETLKNKFSRVFKEAVDIKPLADNNNYPTYTNNIMEGDSKGKNNLTI
jgi:hypothetical protein